VTELATEYPVHVATNFLGHSLLITQRHNWRLTDQDYDRASTAVRNAAQQGAALPEIGQNSDLATNANPFHSKGLRAFAVQYTISQIPV